VPEVRFWLLDVASGEGTVDLWGVAEGGERVVVSFPFTPYFYLVPSRGAGREVGARVEEVERFRLGRPLRCLRIYADDTARAAEDALRRGLGDAYGYDLRRADLFLISTGLRPGSWAVAEAERAGELWGYPAYRATGSVRAEEGRVAAPDLRVVSFNPTYLARRASPRPDRDPVVAISLYDGSSSRTLIGDERSILESFVDYLARADPDVVVSFQGNRVHWDYLSRRARAAGVRFSVGRGGSEPHGSVYGHVSIRGRVNLDVSEFVEEVPEVKLERLEELARYMGMSVPEEAPEDYEVGDLWESDRAALISYSEWRARAALEIFSAISDYVFSLSAITGMPPDHVLTAATGFKVENYLMRFAELEARELIPPRRESAHMTYQGGMVLQPEPGLHHDVAVLDFKSMYPSIIIKYNLSLETVREDGTIEEGREPGFLPRALERLLEERARARSEAERSPEGSTERRVLEAKQRALKRIANAIYGYTGWSGARWYAPHVAAAITAKGREIISSVISKARGLGLRVIYGDTDSVFVSNDARKIDELLGWISSELGLEVKVEKVYVNVLFTEAKKRYAGVTADGRLDVVGLEAVRGDWSGVAKRAQVEVLEVLLREGSVERAVERAREWIRRVRSGDVPLRDLVIWKQLTKPPEDYEATAAHAIVAKRMREAGWDVRVGDKVGFVVVRGPGRIYERARPYFEVTGDQVDWDYYADKQVAAACARILEAVGVDESRLLAAGGRGLEAFFG
jgi:DNA polymerase I